ncbi:MAG: acetyl-CoA C-acetyltransferase [Dehalococcoidia bacterium]|nr:acetyl-CoA C-acetyltransferase [Dehalococcoidia bacterium]
MREVAIVSPLRTAVGRFGGSLKDIPAADLGATVAKAILERTGLDPARVDDVVLGHGYPGGEEPAIGRIVGLKAGLPVETPGYQLDRRCASGLQAILNAAMLVQTDNADVVLAGGVESMSRVEFYTSPDIRWGVRQGGIELKDRLDRSRTCAAPEEIVGYISGMIETAENVAKKYDISREAQDEYAVRSHQRAVAAQQEGRFAGEIVPVTIPQRRGDPIVFAEDEGPRADTTPEALARLRPMMGPDGSVTAGNASSQNDAASLCLVVAADKLDELGLEPSLYLRGWASAGVHPAYMGIGPVPAFEKLSAKTGVGLADIDVVELNEAFASQVLGVLQGWGVADDRDFLEKLNPNGSGISLGHPIAATGARILATMSPELQRRSARYGLETMCVGGGQGLAALFERP